MNIVGTNDVKAKKQSNDTENDCTDDRVTCICNGSLVLSRWVTTCRICKIRGERDDTFWSCSQQHEMHPQGYYICHQCYLHQYTQCQNKVECQYMNSFVKLLHTYDNDMEHMLQNMDKQKLLNIYNHYLHLLHAHDYDDQFEYIFDKLSSCDISQCNVYRRHNRNNMQMDTMLKYSQSMDAFKSIMDRMHCHFHHCYDIGYRLTRKEKQFIDDIKREEKDNHSSLEQQSFVNQQLINTSQLLKNKQQVISQQTADMSLNNKVYGKFHQLGDDMYNIGFAFKYGYKNEQVTDDHPLKEPITVSAKYDSLKTELLNNTLVTLTKEQFNLEYQKAGIHFESFHCKKTYRPYVIRYAAKWIADQVVGEIEFQYILALMVYCNYTELQYQFSKTYRSDQGRNHEQMYWIGKYVKIAVHIFGTRINHGSISKFYHGISKPLSFPKYGHNYGFVLDYQCPLSTSSALEVAMNFTNHNQGLALQLERAPGSGDSIKYFSLSWLSDFSNEKELLFLQNAHYVGLKIVNIIDTRNDVEYKAVLELLRLMDAILYSVNLTMFKNTDQHQLMYDWEVALSKCIISHQLSYKLTNFKKFNSLQEYGSKLLNWFFAGRYYKENTLDGLVQFDYKDLQKRWPFIIEMLGHPDGNGRINFEAINVLMPRLQKIQFYNVTLSEELLQDILAYYKLNQEQSKVKKVEIKATENDKLSICNALDKFTESFRKENMFIYHGSWTDEYLVIATDKYRFAVDVMKSMGSIDFIDTNNEITLLIDELVNIGVDESKLDRATKLDTGISINWKSITSNRNHRIFQRFCDLNNQSIKFDLVLKVFPNTTQITIEHNILSDRMMLNVWMFCKDGISNNIEDITIHVGHGKQRAYSHREKYPTDEEEENIRKKILNRSGDDIDIYTHDFKSFENLYEIESDWKDSDMKDQQMKEYKYNLDTIITSYAVTKYSKTFEEIEWEIETGDNWNELSINPK
eukprot:242006_1